LLEQFLFFIMGLVHSVVQHILDDTAITLGNTTVWPCFGLAAEINNDMQIHVPPGIPTFGLVGIELDSFNMSLLASSCDGTKCSDVSIAHFLTPVTHLKLGDNKATWDIGATLFDATTLLNDFILPMFFEAKTVDLKLSGQDVALGLHFFHGKRELISLKRLKLEKTLSCSMLAIGDSKDISDKFCHSKAATKGRRLDSGTGYSMKCVPKKSSALVVV
jgi:hypothetical protein